MLVKLLTSRTGNGFEQARGEVVDVSEAEGRRMIAAEQAIEHKPRELAKEQSAPETAMKTPPTETAALPAPKAASGKSRKPL